jgi:hypothetical protein
MPNRNDMLIGVMLEVLLPSISFDRAIGPCDMSLT